MQRLGEELSEADIAAMIKLADTDGDGRINFEVLMGACEVLGGATSSILDTRGHGRSQEFGWGGTLFGGRHCGGPGARAPGRWRIFKKFLKKIAKMHYFSKFFKKLNKSCVNFSRVWTKNTNGWEILIKFSKFFKKFLMKIAKMHYFSLFVNDI